jgi:hypothetical protein
MPWPAPAELSRLRYYTSFPQIPTNSSWADNQNGEFESRRTSRKETDRCASIMYGSDNILKKSGMKKSGKSTFLGFQHVRTTFQGRTLENPFCQGFFGKVVFGNALCRAFVLAFLGRGIRVWITVQDQEDTPIGPCAVVRRKIAFLVGLYGLWGYTWITLGGTAEEVYLVERDDVTNRDCIVGFEVRDVEFRWR